MIYYMACVHIYVASNIHKFKTNNENNGHPKRDKTVVQPQFIRL